METHRVLFIDAYDSFTNNIISLLETELPVSVTKIRIDAKIEDLSAFLKPFVAVITGPGPGNPENRQDVGLIADIWKLPKCDLLPVLGICLGFQSLVCAFGGRVTQLPRPRHGIETVITTNETEIFEELPQVTAVQYHSLQAILPDQASRASEEQGLIPLAWDFTEDDVDDRAGETTKGILMAVKHAFKPFFGIQFHPESICSAPAARSVVTKWWAHSMAWLRQHNRLVPAPSSGTEPERRRLGDCDIHDADSINSSDENSPPPSPALSWSSHSSASSLSFRGNMRTMIPTYHHVSIPIGKLNVPTIAEILNEDDCETVVLDSEKRQMQQLGRYSIIGVIDRFSTKLTYFVGSREVEVTQCSETRTEKFNATEDIFTYCKQFLEARRVQDGSADVPFWGGLMGYINYEACLETINISSQPQRKKPDVCFAFVDQSVVVDHEQGTVHVQSLRPSGGRWLASARELILNSSKSGFSYVSLGKPMHCVSLRQDSNANYKEKIERCQEDISAGNSYELCLTNQATLETERVSHKTSPWKGYLQLRNLNPAPFGAYLRLGPLTVLSSSPERFLSWARPGRRNEATGMPGNRPLVSTCQFRPIKGTVKKNQTTDTGEMRRVSLEEATAALSTPKERAENLMIVDLIRHDLHGVVGSGNVEVSSLMAVEEYESVYQLVSVIEGKLSTPPNIPPGVGPAEGGYSSGVDVLAASLPPGSMTGAPKKRSCELLQDIEEEPRSVYSGVLGYMCVGGGGDFSVVIRTIYKWDGDERDPSEEWKIGAGGAITALSNAEDEWEEMLAKLRSTLGVFTPV